MHGFLFGIYLLTGEGRLKGANKMPDKIVWLKAKCPECGATFEYIEGGYKPETCKNFACAYKNKHRTKQKEIGGNEQVNV